MTTSNNYKLCIFPINPGKERRSVHSALGYLRPIDYLEGNPDKLYQFRENIMKLAIPERNQYWQEKAKKFAYKQQNNYLCNNDKYTLL